MFARKSQLYFIVVLVGSVYVFMYLAYVSHTRHPRNMSLISLSLPSIPGQMTADKGNAHIASTRDTMKKHIESNASKITEKRTINTVNSDHIREYHLEQMHCAMSHKRPINKTNYDKIREEIHRKIAIPKVSEYINKIHVILFLFCLYRW